MGRVKVTGYLDLEDDETDLNDPTGMTAEAYENYMVGDTRHIPLRVNDLDDVTVVQADED